MLGYFSIFIAFFGAVMVNFKRFYSKEAYRFLVNIGGKVDWLFTKERGKTDGRLEWDCVLKDRGVKK